MDGPTLLEAYFSGVYDGMPSDVLRAHFRELVRLEAEEVIVAPADLARMVEEGRSGSLNLRRSMPANPSPRRETAVVVESVHPKVGDSWLRQSIPAVIVSSQPSPRGHRVQPTLSPRCVGLPTADGGPVASGSCPRDGIGSQEIPGGGPAAPALVSPVLPRPAYPVPVRPFSPNALAPRQTPVAAAPRKPAPVSAPPAPPVRPTPSMDRAPWQTPSVAAPASSAPAMDMAPWQPVMMPPAPAIAAPARPEPVGDSSARPPPTTARPLSCSFLHQDLSQARIRVGSPPLPPAGSLPPGSLIPQSRLLFPSSVGAGGWSTRQKRRGRTGARLRPGGAMEH